MAKARARLQRQSSIAVVACVNGYKRGEIEKLDSVGRGSDAMRGGKRVLAEEINRREGLVGHSRERRA